VFGRTGKRRGALRIANESTYGLGSAVWTADLERRRGHWPPPLKLAYGGERMTGSDPRFRSGGIKDSGYGRELSHHGLFEFVNFHTVVVETLPTGTTGPAYASE